MIQLKDVPKPEFLDSERISRILGKARADVDAGDKPELPAVWSEDGSLREALHERSHNGKCCYCERKRDIKIERDVEHFRPKLKVKDVPDHGGYWWLAYEWNNLLISCKTCNSAHKKNHFPLRGECKRVYEEGDIDEEDALLINPAIEDPEPYFIYTTEKLGSNYYTKLVASEKDVERGQATIDILGLNRHDLPKEEERSESYKEISDLVDEYKFSKTYLDRVGLIPGTERIEERCLVEIQIIKDRVRKLIRPEKTYSGFRRYLVRSSEQDELVELLNEV